MWEKNERSKGGDRTDTTNYREDSRSPILKGLGISWNQSSRWQALANVLEKEFDKNIEKCRRSNETLMKKTFEAMFKIGKVGANIEKGGATPLFFYQTLVSQKTYPNVAKPWPE